MLSAAQKAALANDNAATVEICRIKKCINPILFATPSCSTNIISGGKSLFTFKGAESKKNGMKALSACRENVRGRVEKRVEKIVGVWCSRELSENLHTWKKFTYRTHIQFQCEKDEGECVAFIMLRERMQTVSASRLRRRASRCRAIFHVHQALV